MAGLLFRTSPVEHIDWGDAVNRILLGGQYREVAREFGCSVGALYRKVEEAKYWEWN